MRKHLLAAVIALTAVALIPSPASAATANWKRCASVKAKIDTVPYRATEVSGISENGKPRSRCAKVRGIVRKAMREAMPNPVWYRGERWDVSYVRDHGQTFMYYRGAYGVTFTLDYIGDE